MLFFLLTMAFIAYHAFRAFQLHETANRLKSELEAERAKFKLADFRYASISKVAMQRLEMLEEVRRHRDKLVREMATIQQIASGRPAQPGGVAGGCGEMARSPIRDTRGRRIAGREWPTVVKSFRKQRKRRK